MFSRVFCVEWLIFFSYCFDSVFVRAYENCSIFDVGVCFCKNFTICKRTQHENTWSFPKWSFAHFIIFPPSVCTRECSKITALFSPFLRLSSPLIRDAFCSVGSPPLHCRFSFCSFRVMVVVLLFLFLMLSGHGSHLASKDDLAAAALGRGRLCIVPARAEDGVPFGKEARCQPNTLCSVDHTTTTHGFGLSFAAVMPRKCRPACGIGNRSVKSRGVSASRCILSYNCFYHNTL